MAKTDINDALYAYNSAFVQRLFLSAGFLN